MERAKIPPVSELVRKRRLTFAGHVWRLSNERTAKIAMAWAPQGKRPRGRPRTTLRRTLQSDGKKLGLENLTHMEEAAQERTLWRKYVRHGDQCNEVAGGSKV